MPDTRAIASLNRQTKADEDLRKWAVEQANVFVPFFGKAGETVNPDSFIAVARKIEDYVRGRTTT